jgi:WD40 repeat protein
VGPHTTAQEVRLMARIRRRSLSEGHARFVSAAEDWRALGADAALQRYTFAQGVGHGLMANAAQRTATLAQGFDYHHARLDALGRACVRGLVSDLRALRATSEDATLGDECAFFSQAAHLFQRSVDGWPVTHVLIQLAMEGSAGQRMRTEALAHLEGEGRALMRLERVDTDVRGQSACLYVLEGHEATVEGARILDDGRTLSWGRDGTLRLWAQGGWELVRVIAHEEGRGLGGTLVDGEQVFSWPASYGDAAHEIKRWSLEDLSHQGTYSGHTGPISTIRLLPDGRLASSAKDGTVRLWSTETCEPEATFIIARHLIEDMMPIGETGALVRTKSGKSWAIELNEGEAQDVTLSGTTKGIVPVPGGRVLTWNSKLGFQVLEGDLQEVVTEGNLKPGAGGGGLFGSAPSQTMVALDASRAASWGESSMFSKAPAELRLWSLEDGAQIGTCPLESPASGVLPLEDSSLLVLETSGSLVHLDAEGQEMWRAALSTKALDGLLVTEGGLVLAWATGTSVGPVASIMQDTHIHRIVLETGEIRPAWENHKSSLRQVMASGEQVVSLDASGALARFEPGGEGPTAERTLPGLTSVVLSAEGTLWAGLGDGRVCRLDEALEISDTLTTHSAPIVGIAERMGSVVSWCEDGVIQVTAPATSADARTITLPHDDEARAGMSLLDAKTLVTTTAAHAMRLWDLETHEARARHPISGPTQVIDEHLILTRQGLLDLETSKLFCRDWTETSLRLSDGRSPEVAPEALKPLIGHVRPDTLRLEGRNWLFVRDDALWTFSRGGEATALLPLAEGESVELCAKGDAVALWTSAHRVGRVEGEALLWCHALAQELEVTGASPMADGRACVHAKDGRLLLLDGSGLSATLSGHTAQVEGVRTHASGLLSFGQDGTLRAWSTAEGPGETEADAQADHRGDVLGLLRLSGGVAVSWGEDGDLRVWEEESGRCRHRLSAHEGAVKGVTHLDGEVFSFGTDGLIVRWDVTEGHCAARFEGHTGAVEALIDAGPGRLLSRSSDGTLRTWSALTGEAIACFEGHTKRVSDAVCLEDGRVLSCSQDGSAKLWGPEGECLETVVIEEVPETKSFFSFSKPVTLTCTLSEGRWALVWDRMSQKKRALCIWDLSAEGSATVTEVSGHILRIGVVRETALALCTSMASLFGGGGRPTPHFWSALSGESIASDDLDGFGGADFERAWGGAEPDPRKVGEWAAEAEGRNLVFRGEGEAIATWLGESEVNVQALDSEGRAALTLQGGAVRFVQLYRGNERVTL